MYTKSGRTIDAAKEKSEGLQKYIRNNKKNKIFGGIITNTDSKHFKGRWIIFNKKSDLINSKNFKSWDTLKF